jgi:hypothetical protein
MTRLSKTIYTLLFFVAYVVTAIDPECKSEWCTSVESASLLSILIIVIVFVSRGLLAYFKVVLIHVFIIKLMSCNFYTVIYSKS